MNTNENPVLPQPPRVAVPIPVPPSPTRSALVTTLAIIGFIAIVGGALWLAISSTRLVPGIAGGLGNAAVYLGSVFTPSSNNGNSGITVVPPPTASTTFPFGTSTPLVATAATSTATTTAQATTTPARHTGTIGGGTSSGTYQVGGAVAPRYYGTGDLMVAITEKGYLTTDSTDAFVASTSVPAGGRPAVKFTINNVGTNWTGTWRFSATIPTRSAQNFESDPQQSLAPGESIDYTLGFDNALRGDDETITITANSSHTANDIHTSNDSASVTLDTLPG